MRAVSSHQQKSVQHALKSSNFATASNEALRSCNAALSFSSSSSTSIVFDEDPSVLSTIRWRIAAAIERIYVTVCVSWNLRAPDHQTHISDPVHHRPLSSIDKSFDDNAHVLTPTVSLLDAHLSRPFLVFRTVIGTAATRTAFLGRLPAGQGLPFSASLGIECLHATKHQQRDRS